MAKGIGEQAAKPVAAKGIGEQAASPLASKKKTPIKTAAKGKTSAKKKKR